MLADRPQLRRQVKSLESLECFLVKITPKGSVVQRYGMGNNRDERHCGNSAVSRIAKKHTEMCIGTDEGRYFVGLHAAADKTTRAKPLRPRLDARYHAKRWPSRVLQTACVAAGCRVHGSLREASGAALRGRNVRPKERGMKLSLARTRPVDQIDELNQVLIRGVWYDAKITIGLDDAPERNIRACFEKDPNSLGVLACSDFRHGITWIPGALSPPGLGSNFARDRLRMAKLRRFHEPRRMARPNGCRHRVRNNGRIQAINSVNVVARVNAFLEKQLFAAETTSICSAGPSRSTWRAKRSIDAMCRICGRSTSATARAPWCRCRRSPPFAS
jgi:hypothetical protein